MRECFLAPPADHGGAVQWYKWALGANLRDAELLRGLHAAREAERQERQQQLARQQRQLARQQHQDALHHPAGDLAGVDDLARVDDCAHRVHRGSV